MSDVTPVAGAPTQPRGSRASEGPAAAVSKAPLRFEPLKPSHVKHVLEAMPHRLMKNDLDEAAIATMCAGPSAACLLGDLPVACGGLLDEKEGRAKAWALIAKGMPLRAWPEIIAEMRREIDAALHPSDGWAHRVWAETIYDWPEGHKLLLHLGMALEGVNRGAFTGGKHGVTYARVRGDVAPLPVRWRALLGVAEQCLWNDSMGLPMPHFMNHDRREVA